MMETGTVKVAHHASSKIFFTFFLQWQLKTSLFSGQWSFVVALKLAVQYLEILEMENVALNLKMTLKCYNICLLLPLLGKRPDHVQKSRLHLHS